MSEFEKKYTPLRCMIAAAFFLFCAAVILAQAAAAWRSLATMPGEKMDVTIGLLFDGFGAALCIAAAMRMLTLSRPAFQSRWFKRLTVEYALRVLLLLQLATTAIGIYAAAVLLLNIKLPLPTS